MNYNKLSLYIVALFGVWIMMSFIPDYFHGFFGDWFCQGSKLVGRDALGYANYEGCDESLYEHNPTWHWGWRHWLWQIMGIILFIVQAFRIGAFIAKSMNKSN